MKHDYRGSEISAVCIFCGYDEISHGANATCEACGSETTCDLFPDTKHPKKMLICAECYAKEIKIAVQTAEEMQKKRLEIQVGEHIKTSGEYFVGQIPSIKEINDEINANESIRDKGYEVCRIVKERINNFQQNILQLNQQAREMQKLQNEYQIYLNHKMKEISDEKQKELGLNSINYKPPTVKKVSPGRAPTTKRMSQEKLDEMKKVANMFGIPVEAIRNIVNTKHLSIEDAAKRYIQITNAVETEQEKTV